MEKQQVVEGSWDWVDENGDIQNFVVKPCQKGFRLPSSSPIVGCFAKPPYELAEELGYLIREI